MKRILLIIFAIMLAGQAWAQEHFSFSDRCETGQTLYYSIKYTAETEYEVKVTYPYKDIHSYDYAIYGSYSKPTGDLVIPDIVTYNNVKYAVTSIDEYAFKNCYGLISVSIPNTVASIDKSAFSDCGGLKTINIPNSVTSIGDWAFSGCNSLRTLDIPNSVTSIGENAFVGCCKNLSKLNIPKSIVSIGFDVFPKLSENAVIDEWDCFVKNLQFNEYGNACYIGNKENPYLCLVKAKSTEITSCTINAKCKAIYDGAFKGCEELTDIAIPNTISFIGRNAFKDCINLTIYCQAKVKHSKWHSDWNPNRCVVVWGATHKFK